jgi:hypothetical protein
MGSHAHACQAFLFQEVDLVDQGNHLRSFEQSRLFTPISLELEKLAYEGREVGFVVLIVEPCSMPSPEGILQGEIKKISTRVGLLAYASYNFSVGCARLVLQEELVFEQGEVWRNPKISLTEMDKNGNLKNTDRVQMNHSIW